MGSKQSILDQDRLDEYLELTYLKKHEILHIFKKFQQLEYGIINDDIDYRFKKIDIMNLFLELKYNPYNDRIFSIFSSKNDEKLSFEDFLDLSNAFSEQCPFDVKVTWIFKLFDFNDDQQIDNADILEIIDRLTMPFRLFSNEKILICDELLKAMDLQHKGNMNQLEFMHAMSKIPEFIQIFSFKI